MNMTPARIIYLQALLDAECISYGELQEIENAFAQLDPATLSDLTGTRAGYMLDELYAYGVTRAHERAAFAALLEAEDDES